MKDAIKNIKWKPYLIAGTVALGGAGVGVGISLGVVLPKANAAKNALEELIPSGGSANSLSTVDKVNYVAIGDSATAGFNGLIGQVTKTVGNSYRSYSDFLASSFQNADRLGDYHNLAISGGRLADISKDLFENPTTQRILADANLITLTIGANDILAVLNMLSITNFYNFKNISGMMGNGFDIAQKYGEAKANNDAAKMAEYGNELKKYPFLADFKTFDPATVPTFKDTKKFMTNEEFNALTAEQQSGLNFKTEVYDNYYGEGEALSAGRPYDHEYETDYKTADEVLGSDSAKIDTDFMITKEDSIERFTQTASQVSQLLSGNSEPFLNLDKDWNTQIFELIKGQIALLTKHLHDVAPKAKIAFLGYAFPFEQFPDELINAPKPALGNRSLAEAYDYLLSEIEAGTQLTTGKQNSYVSFINANELPPVVEVNNREEGKAKDLDYSINIRGANGEVGGGDDKFTDVAKEWEKKIMPNITDIHPSVYGYDKIGEGLFQIFGKELGLTTEKITSSTRHSTDFKMSDVPDDKKDSKEPWKDWTSQADWARLDEDPRLFQTDDGIKKWEGDQLFYNMLNAPTLLKAKIEGSDYSMSDILAPTLAKIDTLIAKDSPVEADILTKKTIADSLRGKFEISGIQVGTLLAEKIENNKDITGDNDWLNPVLKSFSEISTYLIEWSNNIYYLKSHLKTNQAKYSESQVFAYAENGAISMFATYQKLLPQFAEIQTVIAKKKATS